MNTAAPLLEHATAARTRETLSVVIPTKNAAHLLRDCLASVAWADELVVVDMFSDDGTEELCARYPQCRVFRREDYIFGNVNFGFEQATSDWILRLDTDERIPPELAEEIQTLLAAAPPGVAGYELWERPIVLGRELRYGFGARHFRKALFRRGSARYPVQREHEELETSGTWLRLRAGYVHHNYARVSDYLQKIDYYTERDVERLELEQKPRARDAARDPLRAFWLYYFKRRGYRDGWVGFVDAAMRAVYQFVSWAKARERWERERGQP